jgi:hypothetical protein
MSLAAVSACRLPPAACRLQPAALQAQDGYFVSPYDLLPYTLQSDLIHDVTEKIRLQNFFFHVLSKLDSLFGSR